MICGSCQGTGHLLRRWRKGPKRVCGGCDGRGWIIVRKPFKDPRRRVSAGCPKNFTK